MASPDLESDAPPVISIPVSPRQNSFTELNKASWSNFNSDMNAPLKRSTVVSEVINGVASALIPDEVLLNAQPLWTKFIVGHFIGDAPHIGKVHATVNRIWSSHSKSSKIDVQFLSPKAALFRIEDDLMRARVLKRHFWHISDIPLVVQEWNPHTSTLKPDLSSMPIWVDFKHVPDHLFSDKGLMFLGDLVGVAEKLHPNTERCIRLDMARVLVAVNMEKPLPEKIVLENEPENSIYVSYPWLPPRCSVCQSWGHREVECSQMRRGTIIPSHQKEDHVRQSPTKILKRDAKVVIESDGSELKLLLSDLEKQVVQVVQMDASEDVHPDDAEAAQKTKMVGQDGKSEESRNLANDETNQQTEDSWTVVAGKKSPAKNGQGTKSNSEVRIQDIASPSGFKVLENILEEGEEKEEGEILPVANGGETSEDEELTIAQLKKNCGPDTRGRSTATKSPC